MPKIDITPEDALKAVFDIIQENRQKFVPAATAILMVGAATFLPQAVSAHGLMDTQPETMDPHLKLKIISGLASGAAFALKEVWEASRGGDKRQIFTNFVAGAVGGFVAPDVIPNLVNHKPLDINTFSEISALSISAFHIIKSTNFHLWLGEKVKGGVNAWKANSNIEMQAYQISQFIDASKKLGQGGEEARNSLSGMGLSSKIISELQKMKPDERRKYLENSIRQQSEQE